MLKSRPTIEEISIVGGGLLAALDARLETDRRREARKLGEVRAVAEGVDTAESADRLRVGANEVEPVDGGDVAISAFIVPVDRAFVAQRRLDRGIDEEVDVLGETVQQVPSLREAGAALEDGALGSVVAMVRRISVIQ